ncbi:hypothetical protein AUJ84_02085 [Candidatus Pacearchaeota archaeon CG1_02_32_132]|nr:MAG: hypothetical protein AUJ84_02085 [Candidatus Pacearchaeota archaeon CG1_02_32_132]
MLKYRIIPCLLFNDKTIVKSVKFKDLRMVGDPTTVARVFNERKADEMIFLDIMASRKNKEPNFAVIEGIARECFMPLTIGGGIKNMQHVDKLFQIGADKISLNTALVKNPDLIMEIVKKYGSQAVVASIDAKKTDNGYRCFISSGNEESEYNPIELAKIAESLGAGEILLNSIDKDGTMEGYDLELIRMVSSSVGIPVIACGGCGKVEDFVSAIKIGADAVCAASIFYFVGESMISSKDYMSKKGLNMRLL